MFLSHTVFLSLPTSLKAKKKCSWVKIKTKIFVLFILLSLMRITVPSHSGMELSWLLGLRRSI